MRGRPFAVEQVRRQSDLSPTVRWRRLVIHGRQMAAAALGELNGAQPDRGGSARWSLVAFGAELAHAGGAPPTLAHADGGRAVALFLAAGRAFAEAGPMRRRTFAPALISAAQVIEDLMQEGVG